MSEEDAQVSTDRPGGAATGLAAGDLAVDHALALLSSSMRFLLDVTPDNAEEIREPFLAGEVDEPEFSYRELDADPDVLDAMLDFIAFDAVADPSLGSLLRAKARDVRLQIEMLRARGTADFKNLSLELYGSVTPALREVAEHLLSDVPPEAPRADSVDAEEFRELALAEFDYYREQDGDIAMNAEVRDDVVGVLVAGDTLIISQSAHIARERANALLQHEVGTHLVTQVNGAHQPIKLLGAGLARYDETQEGLAVLAEIACGGLTRSRLRQLAARVLTVDAMLAGASFREAFNALTAAEFTPASAYTTVMRVYRGGGFTKDAIYLRGLVDLLAHVREDGNLGHLWLGKFALQDLPLVRDLAERGILAPARLTPRYVTEPFMAERLTAAADADLASLVMTLES